MAIKRIEKGHALISRGRQGSKDDAGSFSRGQRTWRCVELGSSGSKATQVRSAPAIKC